MLWAYEGSDLDSEHMFKNIMNYGQLVEAALQHDIGMNKLKSIGDMLNMVLPKIEGYKVGGILSPENSLLTQP